MHRRDLKHQCQMRGTQGRSPSCRAPHPSAPPSTWSSIPHQSQCGTPASQNLVSKANGRNVEEWSWSITNTNATSIKREGTDVLSYYFPVTHLQLRPIVVTDTVARTPEPDLNHPAAVQTTLLHSSPERCRMRYLLAVHAVTGVGVSIHVDKANSTISSLSSQTCPLL